MTGARLRVTADRVRVGDHLIGPSGEELDVTRIDHGLLGRSDLIAFVEDSYVRWLKLPLPADAEVEVLREDDARS